MFRARILIVEHHQALRDGLLALIRGCSDMRVVDTATSADQAIQTLLDTDANLAIIDLDMPFGLSLLQRIRRERPEMRTISLVSYEWEVPASTACEAVDTSFLPKDQIGNLLLMLIRND